MSFPVRTDEERFLSRVSPEPMSGCWLWIGAYHAQFGYGMIAIRGAKANNTTAHRFAWQLYRGPIPKGMCVLHKCDNPPCVNPSHLFLGDNKDNAEDRVAKGRNGRGGAPLTTTQVLEIRHSPRGNSRHQARQYGVSTATVSRVRNHKTYAWVAGE